jgi:hypothetical protein
LSARGSLSLMVARRPRGPTSWAAVGLALVAGSVFAVDFREFYTWHSNTFAFGIWNCVPMLLALGLVFAARHSGPTMRFAGYGFGAAGLVLFGHIMWAFDIGKTATGSSTCALMFLFLPPWAVIVGAMAAVLAGLIGFAWGPRVAAPPSRPDVR